MKPIEFPEMNAVAAKDQPEFLPLPMYRNDKSVTSCWKMNWKERLIVLFTGKVWLSLLHAPEQKITPSLLQVDYPFVMDSPNP